MGWEKAIIELNNPFKYDLKLWMLEGERHVEDELIKDKVDKRSIDREVSEWNA
jgi:hypothetical protein